MMGKWSGNLCKCRRIWGLNYCAVGCIIWKFLWGNTITHLSWLVIEWDFQYSRKCAQRTWRMHMIMWKCNWYRLDVGNIVYSFHIHVGHIDPITSHDKLKASCALWAALNCDRLIVGFYEYLWATGNPLLDQDRLIFLEHLGSYGC